MPNGLAGSAQVSYPLLAPSGTAGAPSYSFAGDTITGIFRYGANEIGFAAGGALVARMGTYGFLPYGAVYISDGSAAAPSLSFQNDPDCGLYRIGANSIGVANAGNLTVTFGGLNDEIRVRGTGAITNSGSVFAIGATAGDIAIGPSAVGSTLTMYTAGTARWQLPAAGDLIPTLDNTYSIGSVTNRLFFLWTVYANISGSCTAAQHLFPAMGGFWSGGDGIIKMLDTAGTSFNRLQFGGATNLFPAIKRNGANLDFVPADGSASYIDLTCHDLISSSVYLSNIVAVGSNNTYIALGAGGATHSLINSAASFIIQVTGGAVLATFAGTGYLEMTEVTAPSAPAANKGRLYFEDNGAGKTRLMCLFGSGSAQQLAIEP